MWTRQNGSHWPEYASARDPFLARFHRNFCLPSHRSPQGLWVLGMKEAEQNARHAGGGVYLHWLPPWLRGSNNHVPACTPPPCQRCPYSTAKSEASRRTELKIQREDSTLSPSTAQIRAPWLHGARVFDVHRHTRVGRQVQLGQFLHSPFRLSSPLAISQVTHMEMTGRSWKRGNEVFTQTKASFSACVLQRSGTAPALRS